MKHAALFLFTFMTTLMAPTFANTLECKKVEQGYCRAMTLECMGGTELLLNGVRIKGFMRSYYGTESDSQMCEKEKATISKALNKEVQASEIATILMLKPTHECLNKIGADFDKNFQVKKVYKTKEELEIHSSTTEYILHYFTANPGPADAPVYLNGAIKLSVSSRLYRIGRVFEVECEKI